VRAFYEEHNPSKLSSVEGILKSYAGREEVLLERLRKQYNVTHI
jgi:hypothetical protein